MKNAEPFEIIGAPFEVYWAPASTTKPEVDESPASPWALLGTSGADNYEAAGITVTPGQTTTVFRGLKSLGPRKVFRTEEELKFGLTLADMSLEQLSVAFNNNTVTTTPASPGVAGSKTLGMSRGSSIATMALLVRGPSPYMEDGVMQWYVPLCMQTGSGSVSLKNGEAAGVALEFQALVDPDATSDEEIFGILEAQTDEAES
jgi:hypothetical protein